MANVEDKPKRTTKTATAKLARTYFERVGARDFAVYDELWAPDGRWSAYGLDDPAPPSAGRAFFANLFDAVPDLQIEVLDVIAEPDRAAVQWRMTGTFGGDAPFRGIAPTGERLDLEGLDRVEVRDGLITRVYGFTDFMTFSRQVGMLPPAGSPAEERMTRAFNAKTRITARGTAPAEHVADGVWVLRGGFPGKTMNVYFIEGRDGIVVFDAGVRSMTRAIASAGVQMGGITKVILGHGHADHRGAAPGLGVPVFCHEAERADAEGDGGDHYFHFERLNPIGKLLLPRLLPQWDGGPVDIAGTLTEGEEPVEGFRVVHLPGHAPGLIGLFRERDRLALVSDCFYTLDPQTGLKGRARVPHAAFNQDTEQARASIRKLAALNPSAAWPGHADPLTGDVATQLETAAAST